MKQKPILLFLLVALLIAACTKESVVDLVFQALETKEEAFKREARAYFKEDYAKLVRENRNKLKLSAIHTPSAGLEDQKFKLIPLWHESRNASTRELTGVEVPLIRSSKIISLYNFDGKETSRDINLARVRASFSRLLSYKSKSGAFHDIVLTYIPDYDYLSENNFDISFLKINDLKTFTGYIEYSTLAADVLFVAKFEKGRLKRKFGADRSAKQRAMAMGATSVSGTDMATANSSGGCGWVCTPAYVEICVGEGDPELEVCTESEIGEDCEYYECGPEPPYEDPDPCNNPQLYYLCDNEDPGGPGPNPPDDPTPPDEEPSEYYEVITPDEIIDINDALNCFNNIPNSGASYSVSLNVHLPDPNHPNKFTNGSDAGHVYLTMTKTNGNQSFELSFGFYPTSSLNSFNHQPVLSCIVNDGKVDNRRSDIRINMDGISAGNFQTITTQAASSANNNYDLNDYNCANYALDVFNSIRTNPIEVPDTNILGFNYGTTPVGVHGVLNTMQNNGDNTVSSVAMAAHSSDLCD